jgi:hypothetical protein
MVSASLLFVCVGTIMVSRRKSGWNLVIGGESKLDFHDIQANGIMATIIVPIAFLAWSCCASAYSCFSRFSIRSYAEDRFLCGWLRAGEIPLYR